MIDLHLTKRHFAATFFQEPSGKFTRRDDDARH